MAVRNPAFACHWEHHRSATYEQHTQAEVLEHVLDRLDRILHNQAIAARKENREMTELSGLSGELDTLDTDEQANAAAAQAILAIVSQLQAGTISQDQIDQLTAHAATIAGGLEATTASEVAAEPTA